MGVKADKQQARSHADRPQPRACLPIRADRCPISGMVLHFSAHLPDGRLSPCHHILGDETSPSTALYDPFAFAVYEMMRMFWDMEAKFDGLSKERDELLIQRLALESELAGADKRIEELKMRLVERKGGA